MLSLLLNRARISLLLLLLSFYIPASFAQITSLIDDPAAYGTHPQEAELFEETKEEVTAKLENEDFVKDTTVLNYFYDITDRLFPGQRALTPWTIHIIKDNVANASAYADGTLFITTGLLTRFDHEAQLAFVLAHELGHFLDRHSLRQAIVNKEANPEGSKLKEKEARIMAAFSREAESDADKIALEYYAAAGYPRSQATEGMKRMPAELNFNWMFSAFFRKGKSKDSPYRTHPRTPDRIKRLEALVETLEFPENYKEDHFLDKLNKLNTATRVALIDGMGNGGNAKKVLQIDTLFSYLEADELQATFAWDMRLTQATALLNLVSLPAFTASMEMDQAYKEAEYKGQSREQEEAVNSLSISAISIFGIKSNNATYQEQIAAVKEKLRGLITEFRNYPPMVHEADRLEGSLLYEEEAFDQAKPLLQAYLDNPKGTIQRRYVRYMIREMDGSRGKKKKKKRGR